MKAAQHRRWVQRKAASVGNPNARGDEPASQDPMTRADADGGHAVDAGIQRKVESATGADLSGVRVHTGSASGEAASAIKAKAYTVGQNVHFAAGQYRPGTKDGDRLITHELIHTVQQKGAGDAALQNKLEISEPGDDAEREADRYAEAITDGGAEQKAPSARAPISSRGPTLAREPDGQAQPQGPQDGGPPGGAPGGEEEKKPNEKVAKLKLHADVETTDRTKLTYAELKEAKVGHAWISLEYNDPTKVPESTPAPSKALLKAGGTSMGFWPKIFRGMEAIGATQDRVDQGMTRGAGTSENKEDTGFKLNPFSSWVPGSLEEPDDAHAPKGTLTYDLTQDQVDSLMGYVQSKRGAQYSLYFFNCTTFAIEAAQAAGQAAPGGSMMGICLPNALYRDILEEKKEGNKGAETTPLEPGEKES